MIERQTDRHLTKRLACGFAMVNISTTKSPTVS